jgi:hypothetical protein
MPNYKNTVIYKISCAGQDYVGHTMDYRRRCRQHKTSCTNETSEKYNYPLYKHIRETGGFTACEISILEEYPCNTVKEATLREKYWIEQMNAALNVRIPGLIKAKYNAKYNATNKQQIKEKRRVYRETHRDEMNKKQNEYRANKKFKASLLQVQELPVSDPTP